jgi:hypothetical protein
MARKFWTSYNALVGNYSSNQIITQFTYPAGVWTEGSVITAPPSGGNLISMAIGAATIGNARCLKTSYAGNAVVPVNCVNGTWSAGTAVTLAAGGSPSHLGMSLDGIHCIIACDNATTVNAVMFNTTTGLWEPNGYVLLPETNLTNIAITPDGLRGICVPKSSSTAYPLTRNPGTNVWSLGSGIALGSLNTRYFSASIDQTGTVCLIGSNSAYNDSDALVWNGSSWTRIAVPFRFAQSRWLSDGATVLTISGDSGTSELRSLHYDSASQTFSNNQTVTIGQGTIWGLSIPELGRQDIAIAMSFTGNKMIPFTYSAGSWSMGTLISSSNFYSPIASVIMPLLA